MNKPMSQATLKALKGSIRKWELIVAGEIADEGEDNCPLCKRFTTGRCTQVSSVTGEDMETCPVAEAVDDISCRGTPFIDFREAINDRFNKDPTTHYTDKASDDETVMCAVLELEFLKAFYRQMPNTTNEECCQDRYIVCSGCGYLMDFEEHEQLIGAVDCPRCNAPERFGPGIYIPEFKGYTRKKAMKLSLAFFDSYSRWQIRRANQTGVNHG